MIYYYQNFYHTTESQGNNYVSCNVDKSTEDRIKWSIEVNKRDGTAERNSREKS